MVQSFDENSRAGIESSSAVAFVMLFPTPCETNTCIAMHKFWDELGAVAPPRVAWQRRCGSSGDVLCAPFYAWWKRHDEPFVVTWRGGRWNPYEGKRNLNALAIEVHNAVLRKPVVHHNDDECMRQAFRLPHADAPATCEDTSKDRALRPADVPPVPIFDSFINVTIDLPLPTTGHGAIHNSVQRKRDPVRLNVSEAAIQWPLPLNVTSRFEVLPGLATAEEVSAILDVLMGSDIAWDEEPDSVDGMTSHEIFIHSADGVGERGSKMRDSDPVTLDARRRVREQIATLTRPIVEERLTPYVQQRWPEQCDGSPARMCTPCHSLIRRYRPGERRSHEQHYDAHALVTIVVSLSSFGAEYTGGLYLASGGRGGRQVLPLLRGDAVIHQSDLQHGVRVDSGERWSWILWYRDSATCEEHGHEWFAACAAAGNAICQGLHANKVGLRPGAALSSPEVASQMLMWNRRAAENGLAFAMVKLARAHLKRLPSPLMYDPAAAALWFRRGITEWDDAECHYGLAQMYLENQTAPPASTNRLIEAVHSLEAAAVKGHAFAAYNLGVAHLYGHGVTRRDPALAAEWFAASGLPEGLHAVALHHAARGATRGASKWRAHAMRLGYGSPWRVQAREATGSGGAAGVALYSAWPTVECHFDS